MDTKYVWKNIVLYWRLYSRTSTRNALAAMASFGAPTEERLLVLPFHITWSSRVKNDARFHDLEVVGIELVGNEFRVPSEEEVRRLKPKESSG